MATASDFVADPARNISPNPNPTSITPVESDGVHKIAKPDSQPSPTQHGTSHPKLH